MLFWVAVLIFVICSVSLWNVLFEFGDIFIPFFLWLLWTAFMGLVALLVWVGLGTVFSYEIRADNTYQYELRALDSGSSVEGRSYFLGGGYVDNKRVLNHIVRNGDGSSSLGYTDADESRIYEDTVSNPYMLVKEKKYGNWWFGFDATFRTDRTYEYHIPTGSVVESTQITNK